MEFVKDPEALNAQDRLLLLAVTVLARATGMAYESLSRSLRVICSKGGRDSDHFGERVYVTPSLLMNRICTCEP